MKTADNQTVEAGGAALLSSYVNILRAHADGPVIVIDGGDMFQGTMESNLAEGEPVIRFYNYLGVAAAALGNHEFDFGPIGEKAVPIDASDDPQGALKSRIHEAKFPVLAANVVDESRKTPAWLKRSVLYERNGVRVGVVGAATPSTPNTTVRANLRGLSFGPPLKFVEREARALREKGKADVVILTMHGGGKCGNNSLKNQDDLSTCENGEMFELLKALPPGLIDVAVGGHTHMGVAKRVNGTVMIQSYSRGKQLGWAEVPLDKSSGETARVAGFTPVCGNMVEGKYGPTCLPNVVKNAKGALKPAFFLGKEVLADTAVERLISPDVERVRQIKSTPLGVNAITPLDRAYSEESALGNLTADAIRQAIEGADVGVTNGGGLRANIAPGPINYGHVFEVLPFDNRLATMVVDGVTLAKMVQLGHGGGHGSLSWSKLTFTARGCEVTSIEVGGKPLNPVAQYRVVTNDYLAQGGSGMDRLGIDPSKVKVLWEGPFVMRDVVATAIKSWKRDLRSEYFFDRKAPRQKIAGHCKTD